MSDRFKPTPVEDTRIGIFKKRFRVRVPYIETLSVEEIRMHGMPCSGIDKLDQAVAKDLVDRYYTIAEMVEFMRRGVTLRIPKYDDTKKIYEYIQAHLLAWKEELLTQHNASYAPLEDLIDLDKFAVLVYSKAKYVFKSHNAGDFVARSLASLFEGELGGAVAAYDPTVEEDVIANDPNDDGLGKHQSLESLFISRMQR